MMPIADRQDILEYLKQNQKQLKHTYSLESLALIGSMARGDYNEQSDVDFIVRFLPSTPKIYETKQQLRAIFENQFGRPVQITSEKYLKPYYRTQILQDAIYA